MGDAIAKGKVVHLRYVMKNEDGKQLDGTGDEPEAYEHGAGAIVPGLERALEGCKAGDKLSVTLKPEEAFGKRTTKVGSQRVPRASFPADADLKPGIKFGAQTPEGHDVMLYITRVERGDVYVDTEHPFAGMTLSWDVEVVSVSDG